MTGHSHSMIDKMSDQYERREIGEHNHHRFFSIIIIRAEKKEEQFILSD